MATPSNLYAEKVYAEQPIILWPLDDTADYISLISETQRSITSWTNTNISSVSSTSDTLLAPFDTSVSNRISVIVPANTSSEITCVSPNLVNLNSLSDALKTFATGLYFYCSSTSLTSISLGYQYTSGSVIEQTQSVTSFIRSDWNIASGTFNVPSTSAPFRIVLKANFTGGATTSTENLYINGISAGQWSENHNATSLGVATTSITSISGLSSYKFLDAKAYGLENEYGYYLANNYFLGARNTGVPLIYGSSNSVSIYQLDSTTSKPSLIIPGQGFLNTSGKDKEYTLEFWARINSASSVSKKIFGPISSNDGLYVDDSFITLFIGDQFSSYFVSEWYRPMLIHIKLIQNNASVLINGEEVISMSIDTNSLSLPNINDDWLGFYGHSDIAPFEIDCVSIYPYSMAIPVAKRRFVYGQGVSDINSIDSVYSGNSVSIDYTFADYTSNYTYPDFANWNQGHSDNVLTNSLYISSPEYSLPNIFLRDLSVTSPVNLTTSDLYITNKPLSSNTTYPFVTFKPTINSSTSTPSTSWTSVHGYFNFENLNILNKEIKSIYGVFSNSSTTSVTSTLFKISDKSNGNYFEAYQNNNSIVYSLNYNGASTSLYTYSSITSNQVFSVGINIPDLMTRFGDNVVEFFGNRNNLELYVSGSNTSSTTFYGKMYTFGLNTNWNHESISSYFNNGFISATSDTSLIDFVASYTLKPKYNQSFNSYYLDIDISGYWEDYMPLSYFGQYVKDSNNQDVYDLDFIQYNLKYPNQVLWKYSDLKTLYLSPKTYNDLKTSYSGATYTRLKEPLSGTGTEIKNYVTFQYIENGANYPASSFNKLDLRSQDVLDLDDYPNWETTRFEITDNTIIYPKKTVDFNDLAIVYTLDFKLKGILKNVVKLKTLQLSSQAFNYNQPNAIGTKYGINIYPYKVSGASLDYKTKNPYQIYKESTPYLYLTNNSGIKLSSDFTYAQDRGIKIPVNIDASLDYTIGAIQMWLKHTDNFPLTESKLFSIEYASDIINFYFVSNSTSQDRARVYARKQSNNAPYTEIEYYWNGKLVEEPVLTRGEWGALGVAFKSAEGLRFNSFVGSINLLSSTMFNNISYYNETNLQTIQSSVFRLWNEVDNGTWGSWTSSVWRDVLYAGYSERYRIDNPEIYNIYVGTNKIIFDDDKGMVLDSENTNIYSDVFWSTTTAIAR